MTYGNYSNLQGSQISSGSATRSVWDACREYANSSQPLLSGENIAGVAGVKMCPISSNEAMAIACDMHDACVAIGDWLSGFWDELSPDLKRIWDNFNFGF